MYRFVFLTFVFILTAIGCAEDDNNYDQNEQNSLDDYAIEEFLKDYYFGEKGKITFYDANDETDDDEPSLYELGQKMSNGIWIIKNPNVAATGPSVINNDTDQILISFQTFYFSSGLINNYEDIVYGGLGLHSSSINELGEPVFDPSFYYADLNPDNENDLESYYEIEGFVEAIKQFNATETSGVGAFNFQGVIVVPSRLAFGRDLAYTGETTTTGNRNLSSQYVDASFVFNFELHQVQAR